MILAGRRLKADEALQHGLGLGEDRGEGTAQHLAPLPEGRRCHPLQHAHIDAVRRLAGHYMHHGRHHLGRRGEGAAVDFHRNARIGPPLRQDGEAAEGVAAGLCDDPFRHFLLEHERQRFPLRGPGLSGKPAGEQRGADIVGQVRRDMPWSVEQRGGGDLGCIALDHRQLAGKRLGQFGQRGQAAAVHLDGGHLRPGAQQRAGQAAGSGADFQHVLALQPARNGGDAIEQLFVEQEVLAQRLGGDQPVPVDHIAQRGEVACLDFARHERWIGHAKALRAAHSPAMRRAARVAPGRACPVPAMAKAVP